MKFKDFLAVAASVVLREFKNMFDADKLVYRQNYSRMLKLGMVDELVGIGQADYVLAHYAPLRETLGDGVYETFIKCITKDMLEAYIKEHDDASDTFLLHPLGLEVLAMHGFSGFIARHEAEFTNIAKQFPPAFAYSDYARERYIDTLSRMLDKNVDEILS